MIRQCVYEVIDTSNDEIYFTLGVWPSLVEAIAELDSCKSPTEFCDAYDEYARVEIRELKIGWCEPKTKFIREYFGEYPDESDEIVWKIVSSIK